MANRVVVIIAVGDGRLIIVAAVSYCLIVGARGTAARGRIVLGISVTVAIAATHMIGRVVR